MTEGKSKTECPKCSRTDMKQFNSLLCRPCYEQYALGYQAAEKALESEREEIARDAFEASRQEYVFKEGTILELRDKQFPTFQHYWQQKQKERKDG